MSAIALQFCGSSGLGSAAIRLFGHGWASHVDSVLPDGSMLGARLDGGVAIRPAGYAAFDRVERVELPAPDSVVTAYYDFVRAQVGKPYDVEGIAAFLLGRDWHAQDRWFCSELVGAGLERSGYFLRPLATPSNRLTPPDLYLVLSALVAVPA